MEPKPLSADLRELRDLFRRYVGSHQRPTIDACRELTASLSLLAEKADRLEARAQNAAEMEAIARDLDIVASAALSPSLQEALKAQQFEIQRGLDRGEPEHVSRPRLAALSSQIGDSNVVTFPMASRQRAAFSDGGDAA
ncbi:hypothetical protein [Bosea sp. 685]|uniref:hypothetical protein n=1 Tax=Bosea sp. 685 TaxID=3080057 RepID=UPI002892D6A0|nr:hypothetical protein [Bosea sp. 685]WNJ89139.1 hypothetical protein RMR04_22365 [Bosea sp. 685]